jgi:hypothetical protein
MKGSGLNALRLTIGEKGGAGKSKVPKPLGKPKSKARQTAGFWVRRSALQISSGNARF